MNDKAGIDEARMNKLTSATEELLASLNRDEDLNGGMLSRTTIEKSDQLRRILNIQREVFPKGSL